MKMSRFPLTCSCPYLAMSAVRSRVVSKTEPETKRLPGKPVAYNCGATFNEFWATSGYSGLQFWATWLSRQFQASPAWISNPGANSAQNRPCGWPRRHAWLPGSARDKLLQTGSKAEAGKMQVQSAPKVGSELTQGWRKVHLR